MKIIEILIAFPILLIPLSFAILWLIQIIYYLVFYTRIAFCKKKIKTASNEPVSVVICARDEADNLEKNLPGILSQKYENYEVIVVDDCSDDDTEFVIRRLQKKFPHLKSTTIKQDDKFRHGKKLALTIGIKAAVNEWLLLTDADCKVESENWISEMAGNFDHKTSIVLGYGGFERQKGFLNNLIRFDALVIAIQYFSFALAKKAYMGVGRNLAYRKSLFFDKKGFANHSHILSGDDDLFVNQNTDKKNTRIEISPDSHTRTEAEQSFGAWFSQKQRHLTSSKYYKAKSKWLLSLEVISRTLYYIAFAFSLIYFFEFWIYLGSMFAFRFIVQLIIYKRVINRFGEKYLLPLSFFYDIILPYIYVCLFVANLFTGKRNKWK